MQVPGTMGIFVGGTINLAFLHAQNIELLYIEKDSMKWVSYKTGTSISKPCLFLTTHGRKYDVVPTSCTGGHTDIVAKLRRCRCCNKSQYRCNNHIVSLSIHERNSPINLDGFHSPSKLTLPTSEMGSKHVVYQNILSFGEQELEPI